MPMTTRSGSIDPGALFYLLAPERLGREALESGLENDSGLKGLSETSGDMRDLEQAGQGVAGRRRGRSAAHAANLVQEAPAPVAGVGSRACGGGGSLTALRAVDGPGLGPKPPPALWAKTGVASSLTG